MASLYGIVQKFGRIPDIDAADTNEDIWDGEGAYTGFLSAAIAMTVSSSSANDGPASTGALTVRVFYLDADFKQQTADITMSGQSSTGGFTAIRVYRAYVLTAGTNETNVGDIWVGSGTITAGIPAVKYAGILANNGQTLMATYTVPSDASEGGIVTNWYVSGTAGAQNAYAQVALQTKEFGGAWRTRRVIDVAEGGTLTQPLTSYDDEDNRRGGIEVNSKADIRMRILTNGVNNSSFSGGFDVELYS